MCKQTKTVIKTQLLSKTSKEQTSFEQFYSALEAKITSNQQVQVEFFKSEFDHKVVSTTIFWSIYFENI